MRLLLLLMFFHYSLFSQISNSGFENWSIDSTNLFAPDDWICSHPATGQNIFQSQGFTGNYAVRLRSVLATSSNYTGGQIMQLNRPASLLPDSIIGFFRMNVSSDAFTVYLEGFDSIGNSVGSVFKLLQTNNNWTRFSTPVYHSTTTSISHFNLIMKNDNPQTDSSYVDVDNVELIYNSQFNNDLSNIPIAAFEICNKTLLVSYGNIFKKNLHAFISNLDGSLIYENNSRNNLQYLQLLEIDISQFACGIYFYNDNFNNSIKFIIN